MRRAGGTVRATETKTAGAGGKKPGWTATDVRGKPSYMDPGTGIIVRVGIEFRLVTKQLSVWSKRICWEAALQHATSRVLRKQVRYFTGFNCWTIRRGTRKAVPWRAPLGRVT